MSFIGLTFKVDNQYDYFIFPGGAMKAEPVVPTKRWTVDIVWNKEYGPPTNEYAKNWAIRQLRDKKDFSKEEVDDMWLNLNGKGVANQEKEWA